MEQQVILKALRQIRFNVLSDVDVCTADSFFALPHDEQVEKYRDIFDAHYKTCETLSALIKVMELLG